MPDTAKTEALVELAGAVAHELNNIFTAVAGNLSLLEDDLPGGSEISARICDVIRTAQRGIALSSRLQAFAGRQPLRRKSLDLNAAVREVLRGLPSGLLEAVQVRPSLCAGALVCLVDDDKLRACLNEILRNALAAMPEGGQITVETRATDRHALIAISDTGKGMEPHIAARAIEPLFTTKQRGINAGWGLAACAGFARQSGGELKLTSRAGLGTRVELHLPLQQA